MLMYLNIVMFSDEFLRRSNSYRFLPNPKCYRAQERRGHSRAKVLREGFLEG
jgi:hypothetical protein